MANKAISELPQAQNVNNQDLFVLEQGGLAKKLTAETFITEQGIIDALAEALDGHGGISSVTLSSVSGRIRTYLITFTDGSATTFQVYDGTSIDRISRTSSSGLDDVYTVFLSDGTTTFFTVHNGADGDVSEATLNSELAKKAPVITETTESSAIATFTDGADDMPIQSLVAEFEPIQDLPYGDPYPAGGGKNLLDVQTGTSEQFSRSGETFTNTVTDTRTAFSLAVQAYNGSTLIASNSTSPSGTYPSRTYVDITISSTPTLIRIKHNGSTRDLKIDFSFTKTGTFRFSCLVQNSDPATVGGIVLKDLMIAENNYYAPYVPYSNICPISGWTGVNVTRAGKNLKNLEFSQVNPRAILTNTFSLKAGTYTLSVNYSGTPVWGIYLRNGDDISSPEILYAYNTTSLTFTLDRNYSQLCVSMYNTNGITVSEVTDIQLELGSSATAYEAPQVQTVTVDWTTEAGTVYGGTIDVATGLLTVDRAMVDLGTLAWSYLTSGSALAPYFFTNVSDWGVKYEGDFQSVAYSLLCSMYKVVDRNNLVDETLCADGGSGTSRVTQIQIKDSNYTDANTFKTAMSGVQLVYKLATPQTYQLSGQQIMTLLGTNNVWTDIGNVSVTYPADTKMYIQNLTQPTEDDLVANQAITSGKYFMIGNSLYLALANIASGAQITIGTNAQRVSLADALNTINS